MLQTIYTPPQPPNERLPRLRSSRPSADLQTFLGVVQKALQLQVRTEAAALSYQPMLVEDFPKERFGRADSPFDVILYNVISSVKAGNSPNGVDRKPNGVQLFEQTPHPTKAGYLLATYGWQELSIVQFTILAKDNKRANDVCNWFHSLMMRWGCVEQLFRAHGIELFRFHQRMEDRKLTSDAFGQELYERRLQYQIRVQFTDWAELKTIDKVNVTVGMQTTPGGPVSELDSQTWTEPE